MKSSVGSSCGTSGELGTTRCSCRSKNVKKDARISFEVTPVLYDAALVIGDAGSVVVDFVTTEKGQHPVGLEALAYEVAIEPPELALVGNVRATAQAFLQGSGE